MTSVSASFQKLMHCKSTIELSDVLVEPIPLPREVVFAMPDSVLDRAYKMAESNNDHFDAFEAADMTCINALRRGDYIGAYGAITAALYSALLDGEETSFMALSRSWPVMAFCQKTENAAKIPLLAYMGAQIMGAARVLQANKPTPRHLNMAMFVFQSMSIFHILAIKKSKFMAAIETDPIPYAQQMEKAGLIGAVAWVQENS